MISNIIRETELISEKNIVVIVTAAGSVHNACNYELSFNDPSFINIGSYLAIDEIKKKTFKNIILLVKKKDKKFYKLNPFQNIKIVEIGDTKNIIDSIKKSLPFVKSKWCLINPITTIPKDKYYLNPFIEFGEKKIPKENWSSILFNQKGSPIFLSKYDNDSKGLLSNPFTGRILAKKNDIEHAIDNLHQMEKGDLLNLAKSLYFKNNLQFRYTEWLDIGHLATYPATILSNISSRFFNDIEYDQTRNVIKKSSKNKLKIENEIYYYQNIPIQLKRYFPRILNTHINKSSISYEMEYIPKPNLSEIYLFSKIGHNAINRIFSSIEKIFETFYSKDPIIFESGKKLYSEKTNLRKNDLKIIIEKNNLEVFKKIYINDFNVNNFKLPSLKKSYSYLNQYIIEFEKIRPFHLGHGDLCFNNILVDPIFGQLNLIDPKAEKHQSLPLYGLIDNFYDLAKLNHSIEGLYDSLVNNLYNLKIFENNNIKFEIYKPKEYELYNKYYEEILIYKKISREQLRILTGNLFLSMIPLHIEDKKRMISFALIGSIFINNLSLKKFLI